MQGVGGVNLASRSDSWSFREGEFTALTEVLRRHLDDSGSHCVMLVDRSGQLITTVGDAPSFDSAAFASLTAADFSANDQLARLLGETEVSSLHHQGERESMYMTGVAGRLILVALFDKRTTLGMVRLRTRQTVEEITAICDAMLAAQSSEPVTGPGILAGADDEIDQLFR
jgi:predicted regulator of Ras-like GTPase activity (Roadblock/LC7/MglB family)